MAKIDQADGSRDENVTVTVPKSDNEESSNSDLAQIAHVTHQNTAVTLPRAGPDLTKFLDIKVLPRLKQYAARCLLNAEGQLNPKKPPLTDDDITYIVSHCLALAQGPTLSAHDLRLLNLKNTLLSILGRSETKKFKFPSAAVAAAQAAYDRFEALGWGVTLVKTNTLGDIASHTLVGRHANTSYGSGPGTQHGESSTRTAEAAATGQRNYPRKSHPIYGDHGIMRGILISSKGRMSFSLDPRIVPRQHAVFGHNRVSVGQWWPRQICALRDGAHGSMIGGMAGKRDEGIRSVVVNASYEETDRDLGSTIWYSMPKSTENKNPVDYTSKNEVEAMRLSWHSNKDIRVIRGKGAGWRGRPVTGIRYDGLYRITDEEQLYNSHGGLYVRFKLVRQPGQVSLESVTTRPTAAEIREEARVTQGY